MPVTAYSLCFILAISRNRMWHSAARICELRGIDAHCEQSGRKSAYRTTGFGQFHLSGFGVTQDFKLRKELHRSGLNLPGKAHCTVGSLLAVMPSQGLPVTVNASIISVLIGFLNPSR